jgi:hypothetical protein
MLLTQKSALAGIFNSIGTVRALAEIPHWRREQTFPRCLQFPWLTLSGRSP